MSRCSAAPGGRLIPVLLLGLAACSAHAAEPSLSLAEAEAVALARDAGAAELAARRESLLEGAVADAQLPDPELTAGAQNVPVDGFDLNAEDMTMLMLGVRQRFPAGATRALSRQRMETMAEATSAAQAERRRKVVQAVRTAWIEKAWHERTLDLVAAEQRWFEELSEAVTSAYATGRRRQDEVIRISLEADALAEERIRLRESLAPWDAELTRWLGADAARIDAGQLPSVPAPPDRQAARERLDAHPRLAAMREDARAQAVGVDLAKQAYKPAWMLELNYGYRSGTGPMGDRPDMVTAMLSFDVPLFTADRQDRRVAAARADERAVLSRLADESRMLVAAFEAAWARRERLADRIALYEGQILPGARNYVDATLFAYQNGLALFDELVRSEQSLLEARVNHLRLEADRRIAEAELAYLTGSTPGETP
jgi:outer membrane protein TolC